MLSNECLLSADPFYQPKVQHLKLYILKIYVEYLQNGQVVHQFIRLRGIAPPYLSDLLK